MTPRFGSYTPMACASAPAPFDDAAFRFEPKLDGVRVLAYADAAGRVRLQARSGREVTATYPEVARVVADALDGVPAVLDGEACVLDARGVPDFAAVLKRENARDPKRIRDLTRTHPVTFFAFDVLVDDARDVTRAPLEARREALRARVRGTHRHLRVVDFLPGTGRAAFDAATRAGFEGVIAKRAGSPYRPGARSRDWVKVKRTRTADLVVGAWFPGRGDLEGTVGALGVGAFDDSDRLRFVGRVGSGLTAAARAAFRDAFRRLAREGTPFADPVPPGARFVRPAVVVEVAFLEMTRDGSLRAPRLKRVRADKAPRTCRLRAELPDHPLAGAA